MDNYEELKASLELKNEELEKYQKKDLDFTKMTKKYEEDKNNILKEKLRLEQQLQEVQKTVEQKEQEKFDSYFNKAVKDIVGDDVDMLEKVKQQYSRLNDEVSSYEDIEKKVSDAYRMAGGGSAPQNTFNSSINGSGASVPPINENKDINNFFSSDIRELGSKFGLTSEDFDKLGPKAMNKLKKRGVK